MRGVTMRSGVWIGMVAFACGFPLASSAADGGVVCPPDAQGPVPGVWAGAGLVPKDGKAFGLVTGPRGGNIVLHLHEYGEVNFGVYDDETGQLLVGTEGGGGSSITGGMTDIGTTRLCVVFGRDPTPDFPQAQGIVEYGGSIVWHEPVAALP